MPEWAWLIGFFVVMTLGYVAGFAVGSYKNNAEKAPTEAAYIRDCEVNAEAYRDVEIRKAELDFERFMVVWKAEHPGCGHVSDDG